MKRSHRLSQKSAAGGLNLQFFAVVYLLLDKFQPDGWVWGVVGTLCGLLLIANFIDLWRSTRFVIDEKGELRPE